MRSASRIRHSFIGRYVRHLIHIGYHLRHRPGKPVNYLLPGGVEIQLFPEGEVAEFLTVQRFFERNELALVTAYLKPGMTVIDVGANIGLYSILAEKRVGPRGMVSAFEPSGQSFRRLQNNLELNACHGVQPFRLALGATETSLKLKSDPGFGDAYRYLSADNKDSNSRQEALPRHEWVPVTTLDNFCREHGIRSAAFLKIDVEGGEYMVLQGSQSFLQSNSDISIMFESDPEWCRRANCSQQDSFRLLRQLGFGLYTWQNRTRTWLKDEDALLAAEMVWATRDRNKLPRI